MSGVKFMGPAQQEFSSLREQSLFFLDSYWPRWNDYSNPESYMIPPIFKYKNAYISDEIIENMPKSAAGTSKGPSAIINHRLADEAEHLVFDAIEELKNDRIQASFICIQSLDLRLNEINGKLHGPLTEIFPDLAWDKLRQVMNRPNAKYDFILISPKIGIIVVEVKSSQFTQRKHFCEKNSALPDGYKHGLVQLESADTILYFLETCTGIGPGNEVPFNKILFTPNLERKRFDGWIATLGEADKGRVCEKIGATVQWFNENTMNCDEHSNKPPLYTALKSFLEETSKEIHPRFYESFLPVLVAMASIKAVIRLDEDVLSECRAVLHEHSQITKQNPIGARPAQKSLVKSKGLHNGIMFLTPDQQAALNGPLRQLIFGAAGTGKTVVLQAKALELLARGESVFVITPKCYQRRYKQLFDSHGYINYQFGYTDKFKQAIMIIENILHDDNNKLTNLKLDEIVSWCLDGDNPKSAQLRLIWQLDMHKRHTIIDDFFDCTLNYMIVPALQIIMSIAERLSPDKHFWIATDTVEMVDHKPFATKDFVKIAKYSNGDNYSVSFLRHVVRCSKNVFSTGYDGGVWPSEIRPILGHNVQGMRTICSKQHYESSKDAISSVANKAAAIIMQLLEKGLSLNDMAIIYVSSGYDYNKYKGVLRKIKESALSVKHMEEVSDSHYNLTLGKRHLTRGTLTFAHWECVSSYEWPIVFVVNVHKRNDQVDLIRWDAKYRAATRATVLLIEITATYIDDGENLQRSKLASLCCLCF